jgi:hypothetical protein
VLYESNVLLVTPWCSEDLIITAAKFFFVALASRCEMAVTLASFFVLASQGSNTTEHHNVFIAKHFIPQPGVKKICLDGAKHLGHLVLTAPCQMSFDAIMVQDNLEPGAYRKCRKLQWKVESTHLIAIQS